MKKTLLTLLSLLLTAALLLSMASCGKKDPTEKPDDPAPSADDVSADQSEEAEADDGLTKEAYDAMTEEELLDKFVKDRTAATPEEFAALIGTYRFVGIEEEDYSYRMELEDCITTDAFRLLRQEDGVPEFSEYYKLLIDSSYPQVRAFVTDNLDDASTEEEDRIITGLAEEKEVIVLYNALSSVSPREVVKDETVREFVFRMAESDNFRLRALSVYKISDSDTQGDAECLEKMLTLLEDENEIVRENACYWIGELNADEAIEPLVQILNDPAQAEIHDDCIHSLSSMWMDYPFFKNRNEKAYRATLDYFSKTPRDDDVPPWNSIFSLYGAGGDESLAKFKQEAEYFDSAEVFEVVRGVILDPDANSMLRDDAIDVVKYLCTEEEFKSLRADIEALDDSQRDSLLDEYDEIAKK